MDPKIAEIEERRAARRAELAKAEEAQFVKDLEALDELEAQHGAGVVGSVRCARFIPGLPTRVFVRPPKADEYDRYTSQYGRAKDKQSTAGQRDAIKLLGTTCWLYPVDKDVRAKLVEEFPGLLIAVGLEAAKRGEAEAEEEKKD